LVVIFTIHPLPVVLLGLVILTASKVLVQATDMHGACAEAARFDSAQFAVGVEHLL
jgi:hypothetical protein